MSRLVVSIFAILLLLSGCTDDEGEQQPTPDGGGEEAAAPAEPAGEAADGGDAAGADTGRTDALRPTAGLGRPELRIVAEDVVIGALADRLAGPGEVISAIEDLFTALGEDRVPAELLAAGVRDDLENRLAYMIEQVAVRGQVRIGELTAVSTSTYRAPVVAFGREGGRTSGEIYVAQSDGSWYISDILVDFTRIDAEQSIPVFEPGTGGPTLLSF